MIDDTLAQFPNLREDLLIRAAEYYQCALEAKERGDKEAVVRWVMLFGDLGAFALFGKPYQSLNQKDQIEVVRMVSHASEAAMEVMFENAPQA